ncbi:MAG TPA: ComF family protein [Magnetococcales bacterium]|nr:ComF family protein [Magnetococcales bacterium]
MKGFLLIVGSIVPKLPTKIINMLLAVQMATQRSLNTLFPGLCFVCHLPIRDSHFLCRGCLEALPPMPENCCFHCGTTTGQPVFGCGSCLLDNHYPDRVYFPFLYKEAMADLIIRYKFSDCTEWTENLVHLTMERVGDHLIWEDLDLVIPIPLHPFRLLWRGYNQSALLAGGLAKKLHRPLVTNGLHRIKMTRPQVRLNQKDRQHNVHNAFLARRCVVKNRTILLVDDVFTTGSTVWSATKTLKKAGAKRVVVCCLARVDH